MPGHPSHYDIIVIGGGPVGLASAVHGARRQQSVLVLEQFTMPTALGSSGGSERQWRLQYAEKDLAALTLEARLLWRELENLGGRRLLHETGSLWFGDTSTSTSEGEINAAVTVMDDLGIGYEWLNARQIEERFAFRGLPGDYEGFYQPEGGMTDVRATFWVLFELAQAAGVKLRSDERVLEIAPDDDGVTVRSSQAEYRAEHVIIAGGAFANPLLEPLGVRLDLEIYEMATVGFALRDRSLDYPTWFAFQPPAGQDPGLFYGFGRNPWSTSDIVRVSPIFEESALADPYRARHVPDERHVARTAAWVADHLPGLDPTPRSPGTCLIAMPADPNRQFYIGQAVQRVVVYSSGWGFKYVPLFGRACVDLALDGSTPFDLSRFALPG